MSKRVILWLGATLFIVTSAAALLKGRSDSPEIPEILPLPGELDSVTYSHARQIVELTRGFTGMKGDLEALREELTAQRAAITKKED